MKTRFTPVALCALYLLCGQSLADEATFTSLGFLPGGNFSSAFGVSADGQVVAGYGSTPQGNRGFRWTPGGGMENLGLLPGMNSSAAGFVSDDGQYIAGRSLIGCCTTYSTLWSPSGMEYLGPNIGGEDGNDHALAISGDGSVVVGQAATLISDSDAGYHPYRWTQQTGLVSLANPGEETFTYGAANGVSGDGSVVTGWYRQPTTAFQQAFRWTEEDGIVSIGSLTPTGQSRGRDISPDGTIIVGDATGPGTGRTAFKWTAETGMVNYGNYILDGSTQNTVPMAVNADGSTMVGYYMHWGPGWSHIAIIWDEDNGWRTLQDALEDDHGVSLFGWTLREARDISPDGRFIVGEATNPFGQAEAFIVELPVISPTPRCPGDLTSSGNVGVPDLLELLSKWGPCPTPCPADLTGSGSVGVPDLLELLSQWGPCP